MFSADQRQQHCKASPLTAFRRFKRRRLDAPAAVGALGAGGLGGYSSGGYSSGAALAAGYRSPAFGAGGFSAGGGGCPTRRLAPLCRPRLDVLRFNNVHRRRQ